MFQLNFLADYVTPEFKLEDLFSLLIFFAITIICFFIGKKTSATYGFLTYLFIFFIIAGTNNVLVILRTQIESLQESEIYGKVCEYYFSYLRYECIIPDQFLMLIRSAFPDSNEITKSIGAFLNDYSCSVYYGYTIIWVIATIIQKNRNKKKLAKIEF